MDDLKRDWEKAQTVLVKSNPRAAAIAGKARLVLVLPYHTAKTDGSFRSAWVLSVSGE